MPVIYHIATRDAWERAAATGRYSPASLEHEGFIHCSKRWQLLDVANSMYHGEKDLVLLRIDVALVLPEIRSEDCYDTGQQFPHVYGSLEVHAVTAAVDFPPNEDGTFSLPAALD